MKKNFLIILDGPMGSGKTTVAKLLHRRLPRTVLISWDELKGLISGYGQGENDKQILASMQLSLAKSSISNSLNIILDAGFARGERMKSIIQLAKRNNYTPLVYQFTAPHRVLLERALGRPKLFWENKKISRAKIIRNLRSYIVNKYTGHITAAIDSSCLTSEQIVNRVLREIS